MLVLELRVHRALHGVRGASQAGARRVVVRVGFAVDVIHCYREADRIADARDAVRVRYVCIADDEIARMRERGDCLGGVVIAGACALVGVLPHPSDVFNAYGEAGEVYVGTEAVVAQHLEGERLGGARVVAHHVGVARKRGLQRAAPRDVAGGFEESEVVEGCDGGEYEYYGPAVGHEKFKSRLSALLSQGNHR